MKDIVLADIQQNAKLVHEEREAVIKKLMDMKFKMEKSTRDKQKREISQKRTRITKIDYMVRKVFERKDQWYFTGRYFQKYVRSVS